MIGIFNHTDPFIPGFDDYPRSSHHNSSCPNPIPNPSQSKHRQTGRPKNPTRLVLAPKKKDCDYILATRYFGQQYGARAFTWCGATRPLWLNGVRQVTCWDGPVEAPDSLVGFRSSRMGDRFRGCVVTLATFDDRHLLWHRC